MMLEKSHADVAMVWAENVLPYLKGSSVYGSYEGLDAFLDLCIFVYQGSGGRAESGDRGPRTETEGQGPAARSGE